MFFYPRHVSIETSSACNRSCRWCPIQRDGAKGPPQLLRLELYERLLDELRLAPRPLKVTLQWIDEPLMNPRFLDYARLFRDRVPDATLLLQTNGDRLTGELLSELRGLFHAIAVNLYGEPAQRRLFRLGVAPAPGAAVSLGSPSRFADSSKLGRVSFNEKYWSDDWVMEHTSATVPRASRCTRPWTQAAIGFDGAVHVCCRDNLKQHPVGSLETQSLLEAYNSERAQALRWLMSHGQRHAMAMCVTCPASFREPCPPLAGEALERLEAFARSPLTPRRWSALTARAHARPDLRFTNQASAEWRAQLAALAPTAPAPSRR